MAEQEDKVRTFNHSGWTFSRMGAGGTVKIANLGGDRTQITITPESWASIVASLGDGGETHMNWRAALAFHQDAHSHGEPTHIREARLQVITAVDAYAAARERWLELHDARDGTFGHGVQTNRAWLELYDAEQRLLDLHAILTGLEDKFAARRGQPQAQGQEGADQTDPGDEQPCSGGDTSPVAAHRPPQDDGVQTLTVYPAAPGSAYVAPAGTLPTQASVSGIGPASLERLRVLAAEANLGGLQGWVSRNAEAFSMTSRQDATETWTVRASVALHSYTTTGDDLARALVNLARQVLVQHGHLTPGEGL